MTTFLESMYNSDTGKGYGSRAHAETFRHAVVSADYHVVKWMVYGRCNMVLPISVRQHLDELVKLAGISQQSALRRLNMIRLLRRIAQK